MRKMWCALLPIAPACDRLQERLPTSKFRVVTGGLYGLAGKKRTAKLWVVADRCSARPRMLQASYWSLIYYFSDITPVFGIISNCFTNLQNRVISLKKMLIVFCGQKWYIIYYDLFSLDLEDNAEEQKLFNKSENKKKNGVNKLMSQFICFFFRSSRFRKIFFFLFRRW